MKYEIYGDDKIDLADELREEFIPPAKAAVKDANDVYFNEARRLAKVYGPGPAPGQSTPGTVSGNLARLMKKRGPRLSRTKDAVWASVMFAPHAHLLEFGHDNVDGTRTLPRPFIRPAQANTEGTIDRLLQDRLA
jgi:hypothetical protein